MKRKRATFTLTEANYSMLEKYAKIMGANKSRVVNMALNQFFEKNKKQDNEIIKKLNKILEILKGG